MAVTTYRVVNTGKWPKLPAVDYTCPEQAWFMAGLATAFYTHQRPDAALEVFNKLMVMNGDLDAEATDVVFYATVARALREWQGEEKWQKMLTALSIQDTTGTQGT